ncbi:TetR/AcrR family transcriptional regulator C-terminal domain-containing protein [Nocardia carnea]|uniref:TetR/AcrR family transcriptional regulator C-terminal domain-containing protein n=1 Tax=Nocardia carnea TaxID=37328 RepID=A0ABW7TV78_9NOCA|nr:GntR family transcriptional regulator [Nocardia carnea]
MSESNDIPSQRIAAALRQKIANGQLGAGDRIPSTRQLVRDWGVAMATASRALAILRDEGLVTTRTGSGTVVRGGPGTDRPALTRSRILGVAVQVADREGLEAVSVRKLAGVLKVSPMSLYRHVAGRDELETLMVRAIFNSSPLPDPMPAGWRERLETVYRRQWRLYRAHPWLAELTLVTRPPLAPEAMLHTEWTLEALAELQLDAPTRIRTALALAALVHGLALGALHEVRAERQSRLRNEEWWATIDAEASELLHGANFRRLAELDTLPTEIFGLTGLDETFELALGHYLDGLDARQQDRRTRP